MECVKLYYKDELFGILTYNNPGYAFIKNEMFSKKELQKCLGLEQKNEYFSKQLFAFFKKFIPEKSREDVRAKAKIEDKDSEFEILKKVARLDLNKNQFWIGV